MPPGALALITLPWPERDADGNWQARPIARYVLDQDTGGAIQGPGRVDIFVGTGVAAGEQAGSNQYRRGPVLLAFAPLSLKPSPRVLC
jgi:membrane-bound lytic murein transglycosylase A